MSKITKNIFANYLGVVITTALSFLVVPFYLKILGKDSFGLIGIASLIQGWVMLLNSGLAPVTGREAAKAYAIGNSWREAAIFFRTVDVFLISLSL
ncbi:O-antigen transporter, partial [Escherichia coli]|nr:O-antigen transporter [Escherichia coli]EKU8521588.1 O-antigen transporter [Escherichia coli]